MHSHRCTRTVYAIIKETLQLRHLIHYSPSTSNMIVIILEPAKAIKTKRFVARILSQVIGKGPSG